MKIKITKGIGKRKEKAIIGVAMAAIVVVALMTMAPTVSAGRTVYDGGVIIIGESNVSFPGITSCLIKGPTEDVGATGKNTTQVTFVNFLDTCDYGLIQAGYYVINEATGIVEYTVYFVNPSFALRTLHNITGDEVTICPRNGIIDIEVKTNLEHIATSGLTVDFKITDPCGVRRDIRNQVLNAAGNKEIAFTGTDAVGEYTVYARTNKTACNGLDVSSASMTFNVIKSGVTLASDVDTQVKPSEIVFSGTTAPRTQVNLTVSSGTAANVNFIGGKGDLATTYTGTQANVGLVNVTSSTSGAFSFVCDFADTGSYTIKAAVGSDSARVTMTIVAPAATVTTDKVSYCVGEDVNIMGTCNIGDSVAIAVGGVFRKEVIIQEDNTFVYKWDSSMHATGSYNLSFIEVWIIPTTLSDYIYNGHWLCGLPVNDSTTDGKRPDGTTFLLLAPPSLTVKIDQSTVALGSEFVISGTAPGSSDLEIINIAPNGAGGKTLDGQVADYARHTTSVSPVDYRFSKKIDIDDDADTGEQYIAVLLPGADGHYGNNSTARTIADALAGYNLSGNTQAEIISILKNVTIEAAGSDDLMWQGYIKVGPPFVTLNTIADVTVGEPLVVKGITNKGFVILVTVKGPLEFSPVVVTIKNATFSATFDTTAVPSGTYTVKADDGEGNTDTTTVEIVSAVPTPTPTPTAAPTPKPTPTPTPTPTPPQMEATTMPFHKNWNFISVPKALADGNNTFGQVFDDVNTSGNPIYCYRNATEGWQAVTATEEVKPLYGYWIYSAEKTALKLTYDTYPLRTPPTRQLYKGWNAIGFSDTTAAAANSALASIEKNWAYLIDFDADSQEYESAIINNDETGGVHDEDNWMCPMKSYWVYVTEDCELAGISA